MKHGKYQCRLYTTFFVIACCFILLFGILGFWLVLSSQRSSYRNLLQQTIAAESNSSKIAAESIFSTVKALSKKSSALNWAASKNKAEYFYFSSLLYQDLSKSGANISNLDYEISVTLSSPESFFITSSGTVSKKEFLSQNFFGISVDSWSQLVAVLKNTKTLLLPFYKNNQLSSLFWLESVSSDTQTDLIFLTHIPISSLFGSSLNGEFILCSNLSPFVYSSLNSSVQKQLKQNFDFVTKQNFSVFSQGYSWFVHNNQELFLYHLGKTPFSVFYQIPSYNFSILQFLGIFAVLISYAALAIFIALQTAKKLYRPINDAISISFNNIKTDSQFDEFQLICQNRQTVSLLNEQLEQAIQEKDTLITLRYYRELLFGVPDLNCPLSAEQMSATYCVAIVEFCENKTETQDSDWYLQLQKNYLYLYVQSLNHNYSLYCTSTDYNLCAVIFEIKTREEAEKIANLFFSTPSLTCPIRISLSDAQKYVTHIKDCYQQALQLMEYRHILPLCKIITSDSIQNSSYSDYYYPLSVEAQLISALVSGNSSALTLFHNIQQENLVNRSLTSYSHQSFAFALIGTLVRAFEELKTSPEQLLNQPIDFSLLYTNAFTSDIFHQLDEYFQLFVVAVQKKRNNSDELLLQTMLEYIYQNYSDDIMLNDIADYCNISPSYCSTLFKRLSCDNFKTFLNRYRIEKACELLKEDPTLKINEVAIQVGFNSSSSFIRVFNRFIGVSPKAYLDQIQNQLTKET